MRGLLEVAFYPFLVSKKLWWILIIGIGFSLLVKIAMDYQLAKFHTQVVGTLLQGFEPYRLVKRANYLIYAILFWTVFSGIKEYIHTYKKYF